MGFGEGPGDEVGGEGGQGGAEGGDHVVVFKRGAGDGLAEALGGDRAAAAELDQAGLDFDHRLGAAVHVNGFEGAHFHQQAGIAA